MIQKKVILQQKISKPFAVFNNTDKIIIVQSSKSCILACLLILEKKHFISFICDTSTSYSIVWMLRFGITILGK